jgi:uncharacterized protein
MPTIILKASEACNSHCGYCNVVAKKKPKTMSLELVTLLFDRISTYLKDHPQEQISIIWHGGEPLISGSTFFARVNHLLTNQYPDIRKQIHHNIQSNLTLLNQQILDELIKIGIRSFGTSYDPIEGIRGGGALKDTRGYNEKFLNGTILLEQNDIPWGFIYVVHKQTLKNPKELFYFCTNFNLQNNVNFHPVILPLESNHPLAITPHEFVDFLGSLFELWWPTRHRYPNVQPFSMYETIYTKGNQSLGCERTGNCAYSHIYIDPNGHTSHCGKLDEPDVITYGSIKDNTLEEMFLHPNRKILAQRSALLAQSECRECRFWSICHGGCPADSYLAWKDFNHKGYYCDATRMFLEQYFEPITGLKKDFYQENREPSKTTTA